MLKVRGRLEFSKPITIKEGINALGELYPCIYHDSNGTFIFVKKYIKVGSIFRLKLYSIEIRENYLLPMVTFKIGSDIPHKYITYYYDEKIGEQIVSSYTINGYDLYNMNIASIEQVVVNVNGNVVIPK